MFAQYMNWWPNPEQYGFMGYFVVLPAFFAPAVPILALTDWSATITFVLCLLLIALYHLLPSG